MTNKPILICARIEGPLMLPDNLVGKCDVCGHLVQYRPHAPKSIKRCTQCTMELIRPEDKISTTPQMLEDAATYFRRKKQ